ncbi:MAG: MCE family protein [Verrucomicrobia bacterium]|nr:MCE family protein [Verrucomicrobiota bacterium]
MSQSRLEIKVGVFVLVGLLLLATLLILFSKGVTRFSRTYDLYLETTDVGGIKRGASVLMAGYPIGSVTRLMLSPNGDTVTLLLEIKQEHRIRTNAFFVLEQSGFLGDQYVAVYPGKNLDVPFLEPGAHVSCPPPFNLQQTARDASGFIHRIDETARTLNETIADVRLSLLNQQTLTNLAVTASQMRALSDRALLTVEQIQGLVASNRPVLSGSVSNLAVFTDRLNQLAGSLDQVVATNSPHLGAAVKNVESASESLQDLMTDLRAGKGPAGRMLSDEEMAADLARIAHNLSITSSNLNRLGLWGILWKRKEPRDHEPVYQPVPPPSRPIQK